MNDVNTTAGQAEAGSNPAAELGTLLRLCREEKGLSVGAAAESLKYPARRIEALEQGDYAQMPETVFIKGFLRTYAALVGLESGKLEPFFDLIFPPTTSKPSFAAPHREVPPAAINYGSLPVKRTLPKWILLAVIAVVVCVAVYLWQSKSGADTEQHTGEAGHEMVEQSASAEMPAGSNVRVVPMGSETAATASPTADTVPAVPSVQAVTVAEASAPAAADDLLVKNQYRTWVKVTDADGKILVSKIMAAGSEEKFAGKAPYRVVIGYVPGTSVFYRGQEIGLGAAAGTTAAVTVGGN